MLGLGVGLFLAACAMSSTAAGPLAPVQTSTPSVYTVSLPALQAAPRPGTRVLFINGDHVPDNGYPHSRIADSGEKPESFTRLRREVIEGDLKLSAEEFILTAGNAVTPNLLAPYAAVVLGSNARVLAANEVKTLTDYYNAGGSILVYADFQYGPNNWASDNRFLNSFGIEVLPDNFQPTTNIDDKISESPILSGVTAIQGEGISQFIVRADSLLDNKILLACSPSDRPGCTLPEGDRAKVKPGDVVACVFTREHARGGRLAGVCDRNPFHNGPGPGSDLDQVNNRVFARNLFAWLSRK
jgi:hypothetical protein